MKTAFTASFVAGDNDSHAGSPGLPEGGSVSSEGSGWSGKGARYASACALTTLALVFVTKAALRERYYSAVMAATGLLYLAILTAFGTDVMARAVLAT